MAKVTVRQEEYVFSHGKPAKGKGGWVFSKNRNDPVDEMFFAPFGTVTEGAKAAAAHFGTNEVWAQP